MTMGGGGRAAARRERTAGRRGALPSWLRKTADKVPTAWFGAILTAVFLLITAAFGSLETAPEEQPRAVALFDTVTTDQFAITVLDVTADRSAGGESETVTMLADIENLTDDSIGVTNAIGTWWNGMIATGELSVITPAWTSEVNTVSSEYADDNTALAVLTPGLPEQVRITWTLPSGGVPEGDLTFEIWNSSTVAGQWVIPKRYRYPSTTTVLATLSVAPSRVGAEEDAL